MANIIHLIWKKGELYPIKISHIDSLIFEKKRNYAKLYKTRILGIKKKSGV